ncbi:MAG: MATE family efflux transporter [Clostridia bacterium]|nr:MATE family efflux transporter [Clostridia bacterium]
MKLKQYFGDGAFFKMTLTVALPIMLQNFITNFVNMLDNLMVGATGTEQVSGVSIVNQLVFIFNLAIFGALSGAGIFTAQFYGKNDSEGIRYTLRYKLIISTLILVVGAAVFIIFPKQLISLYLHEGETEGDLEAVLMYARQYLSLIIIGLLPFALSQTFASTLRETGETLVPVLVGFIAVVINCVFNYLLIFGKFGFPQLGVKGAAIATVMSRYAECIIIIIYTYVKKKRFTYINGAFASLSIPGQLVKSVTAKGMPLLFNEFFWSLGMSLLTMSYSLHGIDVVAGVSISSTVTQMFNIAFVSMGSSTGIIVGKLLGANSFDEAVDTEKKLMRFSVLISIFMGIIMFCTGNAITGLYNTSAASKEYAAYFIRCCTFFLPAVSVSNSAYFTLRSGGKTYITILFDSVYTIFFNVPVAFGLFYIFSLPIKIIFPIVQSLEIFKAAIGFVLVRKKSWVRNIVE